jgi:hypothetical protein
LAAENFWLTLQIDLTDSASEGPGWYVHAGRPGMALIPVRRITKAQAEAITTAFGAADRQNEPFPVAPSQLLESGNLLIKQAIDAQLEQAEAMALKIARLRELQAAEREDPEEISS